MKKKKDLYEYFISKSIVGIPPDIFEKILKNELPDFKVISNKGFTMLTVVNNSINEYYAKKDGAIIKCIGEYYCGEQKISNAILKRSIQNCQLIQHLIGDLNCGIIDCIHCHLEALRLCKAGEIFLKSEGAKKFDTQE